MATRDDGVLAAWLAFVIGMRARRVVAMLACVVAMAAVPCVPARATDFAQVRAGYELVFPRDHGAHLEFRTEWWYVTGFLDTDAGPIGFQITFFRSRTGIGEASASPFAPRQLLFAHAAVADPRIGRLLHDERAARAGLGLAEAKEGDTNVWIDGWSLRRSAPHYQARIVAREFALSLEFIVDAPPLLQGEGGYSRKGPRAEQASYYYSRPHLRVSGQLVINAKAVPVRGGTAWLDHEWSSELMAAEAQGWDWLGLNLHDGSALMAFRMRRADGTALWSAALHLAPDGSRRSFPAHVIAFEPRRQWRSHRSQASYPVALTLRLDDWIIELEPLFDDQELDARASVGTIYWEGAVRARRGNEEVGRGYLELTGYWKRLRF